MNCRVGLGYDSHRFDPERPLVLGGVRIPDSPGLTAHSDGDAVAHAVTDALLGACGLGDIGRHFPPSDPHWKDADSIALLRQAAGLIAHSGFNTVNVDITVVAEKPRIGPHAAAMSAALAAALGVHPSDVSVKGKSNEGLGWIGAGEGLAVHAVALVSRSAPPTSAGG